MPFGILKVCASHIQEHDFNKLRRTGFKSEDLFCPTTLDQIQKKQERSPKRQKMYQRSSFQSNRLTEDRRSSGSQSSGSKFFCSQQDKFKNLFIYLFGVLRRFLIYLGFYVAFNTVQVISRRVVGRAEETST